jgi:hypothetical protein
MSGLFKFYYYDYYDNYDYYFNQPMRNSLIVLRRVQVFDSGDFDGESFDPELKTEGLSRTVAQNRGTRRDGERCQTIRS